MKVTLISLDRELFCPAIRILSSYLKQHNHETKTLFLVPEEPKKQEDRYTITYSDKILENVINHCSDSRLVGMSLMSNQFIQASALTKAIKKHLPDIKVIWGGIQPTVEPEECLKIADFVCVGDGENALIDLVNALENGLPTDSIQNIWTKGDSGIIRNPLRPLVQDLDRIPFPDYSCNNHFVIQNSEIVELTKEKLINFSGERFKSKNGAIPYMFLTSRGCPYSCTYCANSVLKKLYPGQKTVRWRSDQNIIDELKMIQSTVAPLYFVFMVDDNFTARSAQRLKEFCQLYKQEIGVPFFAQVSPLTIDKEKMDILFENGCAHITMGVETASARIAEMYNRSKEHKVIHKAIAIVENYRSRMSYPPTYQFIIDNPYETIDDTIKTLRLAVSVPRPWSNPIYSLMLFPGVSLYEKAVKDGILKNKHDQIYGKNWRIQSKPFFQFWIFQYHSNRHPLILKFLLLKPFVVLLTSKPMEPFFNLLYSFLQKKKNA